MIRLGKVIFNMLLILGKSFNEENHKNASTSVVLPAFILLKFASFRPQMEINSPITATTVCNSPAMNHSYLTTLVPVRLGPMLHPFVLNELTESLID